MFIFVKLAFGGHCLHFQVYTINSMILKKYIIELYHRINGVNLKMEAVSSES